MKDINDYGPNDLIEEDTEVFQDLEYAVDYKLYLYRIEFTVYKICPTREAGSEVWENWYQGDMGPTRDKNEAGVFLDGEVKWDGCSNWDFHPGDKGVFGDTQEQLRHTKHFCDQETLMQVGVLLSKLWKMGERIPAWSK